jgi:hypothetical protein
MALRTIRKRDNELKVIVIKTNASSAFSRKIGGSACFQWQILLDVNPTFNFDTSPVAEKEKKTRLILLCTSHTNI